MFCDMFVVHLDLALVHLRFAFLAEHMKLRCVNQKKCQNFTIHLWFTNQHVKIYNHLYIYHTSAVYHSRKSPSPQKNPRKVSSQRTDFHQKNWRISIIYIIPSIGIQLDFQFSQLFLRSPPKKPGGKSPTISSFQLGSDHFQMLPSEDFMGLDDYIELGNAFGENA